ncbi:MAG: 4Fe-4S binding protein [Candidatus Latescibacteria bacterium]|nr:4Fe-4S binding protein [Candidatus Latescibacterota bacterium]
MKRVYPVGERCINCHLCEVACVVEHSQTKQLVAAYTVEGLRFNREYGGRFVDPAEALDNGRAWPLARCFVDVNEAVSLSTGCRHCEDADCILACKNGSLYKDETGRVRLNEERCVGCWMCLMVCRYGAIGRNPYRKNVPEVPSNGINHHCDLCPERLLPACVTVCPTRALVYEERG